VHAFVNELERPVGTYLYGRGMYETMRSWETAHTLPGQRPVSLDFARIWQAADKIVYSATLPAADTALPDRVRLDLALAGERRFGNGTVYLRYHPVRTALNVHVSWWRRRRREVITLRVFFDLDTEATATTLGISPGTVGVHLHRALAALRAQIPSFSDQEASR
jgi:hypothetical protein